MANIFDTSGSVQAVTANQTPIQGGVVDTSTAQTIKAVADIGATAIKQIGSQRAVSEAQNILENPANIEVPEIEPYMDRLGKLADGVKAGMQRNKAQIMARKVVAEAINQHPFYAKEIKERASSLFGIGGSTGASSASVTTSPEEKALNDYREAVTTTQLEFGVSQQTAQNIIQSRKEAELRKVTAENFTDDIYTTVNDATISMQDELFKTMLNAPTGTLTIEQQRGFEVNVERSAVQLQKSLMQAATSRGAVTKATFETIDAQVKQYKTNMKALISDADFTKWLKAHNDLAAETITAWGNQNYGGLKFLSETNILSESSKDMLFRAAGNDERAKALIASNPVLADMQARSGSLATQLKRAYGGVMNDMVGSPDNPTVNREVNKVGDNDKVVVTSLLLNDRQNGAKFHRGMLKEHGASTQEVVDKMLLSAPENIIRWVTPQYQAEWSNDAKLKKLTLDHELDVTTRGLRSRIFSQIDNAGDFDSITISEPQRQLEEVRGTSAFYGAGASAPKMVVTGVEDPYIKSRLMDVYRVLEANPDIWEDNSESAGEYLDKLIKRPVDWKMPTRMRVNKSIALGLGEKGDDGINRNSANS